MSCEPLSLKVIAQLGEKRKTVEKVKCGDTNNHLFTVTLIIISNACIFGMFCLSVLSEFWLLSIRYTPSRYRM